MRDLTAMPNIGKEMASKLNFVGISSGEELIAVGSKQAFYRLKTQFPQVCLVHLYALEAAIQNVEFNNLSENIKKDLKVFSDSLK